MSKIILICCNLVFQVFQNFKSVRQKWVLFYFLVFGEYFFVPCRKFRSLYLGQVQQLQVQRYPFLSVCAVFKSSATHSYQCVQYFPVSRQWCGCQCLGFLTRARMLIHAIAHGGCTDVVRESALAVDSGWKIPRWSGGLEPVSVLHLAFQSDTPPIELSPPTLGNGQQLLQVSGWPLFSKLSMSVWDLSLPV